MVMVKEKLSRTTILVACLTLMAQFFPLNAWASHHDGWHGGWHSAWRHHEWGSVGLYYDYAQEEDVRQLVPSQNQGYLVVGPFQENQTANVFSVDVPNNRGGYIQVVLRRSGKGFVGPQGEFYPQFPELSRLKALYGK